MAYNHLFIAEKPDLAKAIAEAKGGGTKQNGFFECGGDAITWCFGHMLELLDPHEYDPALKEWRMENLPFAYVPWKKKVSKDKAAQVKIISGLMKQSKIIVNAGDPDDEGQLLVDELIDYFNCRLPVKRLLINDNNIKVVQRSLASMRDNNEFRPLGVAAEARSVSDQLYGYNLTRAYTLSAQSKGHQGVLSVGRVQTPVLGLVVRRDREHEAHEKSYYYVVTGDFLFGTTKVHAKYKPSENAPVDEKKRLLDEEFGSAIADQILNAPAIISHTKTELKSAPPPLPYNLLKLQADASRKFGYTPKKVKEITQGLREKHRLITYNRSDCQYLSDEQHADAGEVLAAIAATAPVLSPASRHANPEIKSPAFNSAKVSAHHAIIPTETVGDLSSLSEQERNIYLLIARAYIAQFFPNHEYLQTKVEIACAGHAFECTARATQKPGWLVLYKNDKNENESEDETVDIEETDLSSLEDEDKGKCTASECAQKETKPPARYTMDTLLMDLTRVAKYVKDPRLKAALIEKDKDKAGEHGGIGTPATRDDIIANLFSRGFLEQKGKEIKSTQTAREFYDVLPDQAKYPDMTAIWHEQQKLIKQGKMTSEGFVKELMKYVSMEVGRIKSVGIDMEVKVFNCPQCEKPLRRFPAKAGRQAAWGCTGFSDGCKTFLPEKKGEPDFSGASPSESSAPSAGVCPKCSGPVKRAFSKKTSRHYWFHEDEKAKESCTPFISDRDMGIEETSKKGSQARKGKARRK